MGKNTIVKSINDELRQATYVAMNLKVDAHGETTNADEIRKACHNFNRSPKRANLFHRAMTDSFEFIESYILPADIEIEDVNGSMRTISKGSWLVVTQTHSDEIWEAQKDGRITGVSIGARGQVVEEDTD